MILRRLALTDLYSRFIETKLHSNAPGRGRERPHLCFSAMAFRSAGIRGGTNWKRSLPPDIAPSRPTCAVMGQTDKPDAIDQYTLLHLTGDMVGLLDAIGTDQAVVVGHDWGAPVAWRCALFRPDRFRAVVGLSVPFPVRGPDRPSTVMPRGRKAALVSTVFPDAGRCRGRTRKRRPQRNQDDIVRPIWRCAG